MSSERDRRRVSFRGSPPSGSSSRNPSDSGVGSLSGSDQGSTRADRSSTARDVQGQWDNLPALQEAYRALHEAKEHWKSRARQLEEDLGAARKATKELDQQYRTIQQHNEDLENDKAKIFKEKKSLAAALAKREDEIQDLRHLLADANASVEKLRRNSPPLMSGANPSHHQHHRSSSSSSSAKATAGAESSSSRPQRSSSKRGESGKEQKQRLEKRFEHGSGAGKEADVRSDSTAGSSSKSSRNTRRSSYIEPFGPAAPPSTAATTAASSRQMPPPPPPVTGYASYPTYTQAAQAAPVISQTQEPTYSTVPRSVRPHVTLEMDSMYDPVDPHGQVFLEDGNYHPYPLGSNEVPIRGSGHHRGGQRPR